jgi:phage-related protein
MNVKIIYHTSTSGKNYVREFILSLQKHQQAKIRRLLQLITEYGLSSIIPHTKKLSGTPLWEIRILGKNSIRIIYVVLHINTILALHGFIKKTQKTPRKEINTALKRYQNWLDK